MRLAAVFIIDHYLFEDTQIVNIVENYFYDFEIGNGKIIISREKNVNYVNNLHSNNITELSAIVGANGSGKTTLFSIINMDYDTTEACYT